MNRELEITSVVQQKEGDKEKDKPLNYVMVMRFARAAEARQVAELLGVAYRPLGGTGQEVLLVFRLVDPSLLGGHLPGDSRYVDLPVRLRSGREVLEYLGQGVAVPAGHSQEGLAVPILTTEGKELDPHQQIKDLFEVRQSVNKPANALTSIFYRDRWYYIDDSDQRSKLAFSFLITLMALQSGNPPVHAPLLTLSVGGGN